MFIRMCGQLLLAKSWCGERGNSHDIYAVSVIKDSVVVGHFPRKILPIASLFLVKGGMIYILSSASVQVFGFMFLNFDSG